MKNLQLFAVCLLFCLFSCKDDGNEKSIDEIQTEGKISSIIRSPVTAEGLKDTVNVAKIAFKERIFDFGEVAEGAIVQHTFDFTNTGKVPLVISDAHSTCGCTIPKWPKEPIAPGESGAIRVEFNTKSKLHFQEKPVIISANTYPAVTKVFLQGYVRPERME